jgi:predicted unusual protein kinase regulating ubiquinone biosynthesis (AarF/ABC1/UbiB family)
MATAAVNAAVAMRSLEAPDLEKSYIALDRSEAAKGFDDEGLPLVYDKQLIEQYWKKERGALNKRWSTFVGKAVPFLTKLITLFIRDGKINDAQIPELSRQARIDIEELGPTFIKAGQMMSIRPDVLPPATLEELTKLQDSVVPFETEIAVQQIERELGGPLGQFFTSISQEPVAAASLAQVYLATLNDGKDTKVAVKVQRPNVLGTVSKDLYVLRRAAEVWQGLIERFAPQQKTNYVALLNEWAVGFYTELDFNNEARNQRRLREDLIRNNVTGVMVPKVYEELCTRRILVSEWVDGKKLSSCTTEEIAKLTPIAQEAFLTQLFETGFFHADPHPGKSCAASFEFLVVHCLKLYFLHAGNLLKLNEPTPEGHRLALIDCGLMATINPEDRDNMISTLIHLANKDYPSLVDDFIRLKILPPDTNRPAVIPLMDKALSPYVKGGGAKKYEEELRKIYGMEEGSTSSQVGGFQAMTQDALTVLNDIPFSIPPYFAILGRAIITLEGVALTGNPEYGLIMESYPFISRKLLREDRPEIQSALQEVLFSGDGGKELKLSRLLVLLNNAAGAVSTQEGGAFVDLDSVPEDGISFSDGLKFLLSDKSESLRNLLESEVDSVVDIVSRQIFRKGISEAVVALTPPRPPALPFLGDILPPSPKLDEIRLPFLLPRFSENGLNTPSVAALSMKELTDILAPKLTQDEDIYAIGLAEAAKEFLGEEVGELVRGEGLFTVQTAQLLLTAVRSGALGRRDLVSNNVIQSIISFLKNSVSTLRGSQKRSQVETELLEAFENLNAEERDRFDDIVNTITERGFRRVLDRISKYQS